MSKSSAISLGGGLGSSAIAAILEFSPWIWIRRIGRSPGFAASTALVLLLLAAHSATAGVYSYTRIASTSDFGILSIPSINNSGTVAFVKRDGSPGDGLYTGNGGPLTPITTAPFFAEYYSGGSYYPSVNNAGHVTFYARQSTFPLTHAILSGNGGAPATIVADPGPLGSGYLNFAPSIADDGRVVFAVSQLGGIPGAGVFVGSGGVVSPLITNSTYAGAITLKDPAISDAGTVAYQWPTLDGASITGDGLYVHKDGQTTTIATLNGSFFDGLDVNDAGMVVASIRAGIGRGIYLGDGGPLTTLVGPSDGFDILDNVSINDLNKVAFYGAGGSFAGILTGPDVNLDKVIATGDALDGSTVSQIAFGRGGLNDAGQVAFWARLADGRQGVYIAVVPEPSVLALLAVGTATWALRRRRSR